MRIITGLLDHTLPCIYYNRWLWMVFVHHDIQSNSSCCGSVSWWHCNHHSLSGECRCNVPYGWMVLCSIINGGFTWWRHGLRPCEQVPGTRVPGFWFVQRKVFQSPFGGLSWHVLFEADSSIEFYHSLVRWEVSSRLIDPKKRWQYNVQ